MAQRLPLFIISAALLCALTGCNNQEATTAPSSDVQHSEPVTQNTDDAETETTATNSADTAQTEAASDQTNRIDWSQIDSGEKAAPLAGYEYPFALDSQSVSAYADYFNVDAKTAQHNLTIGMASNEALSKILDQLSGRYVSHELSDGDNVALIIHTSADMAADRYDYVLADDFAKGLVLPIVIQPDGKKVDMDDKAKAHGDMPQ